MRTVHTTLRTLLVLALAAGCGDNAADPVVGDAGPVVGDAGDTCLGLTCGHGVCAVSAGQPLCVCADGYHAQQQTCAPNDVNNPCAGVTCSGHGACAASSGKPLCACDPGYHASGSTTCMPNDVNDPCAGVTCSGRGVCAVVGGTTPTCVCNTGYIASGTNCVLAGSGGGELTLLAGAIGTGGSTDGAPGTARFVSPVAVVANGATLYVAEAAGVIRKVDAAGAVSTLAGLTGLGGENQGYVNDTGASARFRGLGSIAVDSSGNVFVNDSGNCAIRKVTPGGVVTTLAGALPDARRLPVCGDESLAPTDGLGNDVRFIRTRGLTIDSAGNLYAIQSGRMDTGATAPYIRKITPAGQVSSIEVTGNPQPDLPGGTALSVSADGTTVYLVDSKRYASSWLGSVAMSTGAFTLIVEPAGFRHWYASTCVTASGTQYLADEVDYSSGGAYHQSSWVTKLSGTTQLDVASTQAGEEGYVDAVGDAARFRKGLSLFCDDANGRLLVADPWNNVIRAVDTTSRAVSTVAGIGATTGAAVDGTGAAARFSMPYNIVADSSGAWYLTDTTAHAIRKVTAAGVVTTFAGLLGTSGTADGSAGAARFNQPKGLAIDSSNNLYVGDLGSIRKVTPAGEVTTLSSAIGTAHSAESLAVDSTSGTLFYVAGDQGDWLANAKLLHISTTGSGAVPMQSYEVHAGVSTLTGLAIDGTSRRLYSAYQFGGGGAVLCLDLTDPAAAPLPSCVGGPTPTLDLTNKIVGQIALGPTGTLYVLRQDSTVYKVLTVPPFTTSLVAGAPGSQGVELGPLPARLFHPMGLAVNPVSGQLGIISDQDGALLVTTGFTP